MGSIVRENIKINMAKKRAHKTLSLGDKLKIIEALNRGQSGKILAEKFGVGASTICDIKKIPIILKGNMCNNCILPKLLILLFY